MSKSDIIVSERDAQNAPRRLAYLLIDGFALMSYAPVIEPFRAANRLSGKELYVWSHFSTTGAPALASTGLKVSVDGRIDALDQADILFVCAGGNPAPFQDARTLSSLRRVSRFGTLVAGVSGGPFIMARAGLLDGYRCTVHWEYEKAFEETFTTPKLERGLFVLDRDRLTCAGGLAGLDMAISLIASDHGNALANKVSDWYIQTEQRQPARPQRQSLVRRYRVSHGGLIKVLSAMENSLADPVERADLAKMADVSIRQLERLFKEQLGTTVAAHYLKLRLDQASKLLVETTLSLLEVGIASGFASRSHFSKAFNKRFSRSPAAFRKGA